MEAKEINPQVMAASCQCVGCLRYLAASWEKDADILYKTCVDCGGFCRRAAIRDTLTNPLDLELLSVLDEECHETGQRKDKIIRWGWQADFEGTTQLEKLEREMGDILAAMDLMDYNKLIDLNRVLKYKREKMRKFREDAAGPKQRLLHARVPEEVE